MRLNIIYSDFITVSFISGEPSAASPGALSQYSFLTSVLKPAHDPSSACKQVNLSGLKEN